MHEIINQACRVSNKRYLFDLDHIWHLLGYRSKRNCLYQVHKLKANKDYIIQAMHESERRRKLGGFNRIIYMLNAKGLKKLICSCNTKLARNFHAYLIEAETAYLRNKSKISFPEKRAVKRAMNKVMMTSEVDTRNREIDVRDALATKLNAKVEIPVKHGRIDVMTDEECIEVKTASKWKHALGQILVYADSAPCINKKLRIHLYDVNNLDIEDIRAVCAKYGVHVTTQ